MGWLGAVDVMQAMARRLIFEDCGVPPSTELRKDSNLPEGDVSVVCMDGLILLGELKSWATCSMCLPGKGPMKLNHLSTILVVIWAFL